MTYALHGKPVLWCSAGKRVRLKYAQTYDGVVIHHARQRFSVELDPWPAFGVAQGCHHQRRRCKFRLLLFFVEDLPLGTTNLVFFLSDWNWQRSSLWSMNEFIFKLFSKRVNRQIGADTVPLPSAAPVRPISAGETNSNRKKRLIKNHFIYRQILAKRHVLRCTISTFTNLMRNGRMKNKLGAWGSHHEKFPGDV